MSSSLTSPKKHLVEYLPAIYQDTDPPEAGQFLARFLLAYERLLLDGDWKEIEATHKAVCDEPKGRAIKTHLSPKP